MIFVRKKQAAARAASGDKVIKVFKDFKVINDLKDFKADLAN